MRRKNSYDFIRLVAASLVVFSHSFALSGNEEPLMGGASFGTIGVWIFFILSGYLIAISWDQYPRFNIFFAKRALRIFPGLAVNIILTLLVLGVFFSSFSMIDFFRLQGTLDYLNNILLYDRQGVLPGVFTQNIYSGAINGSLWTLSYEFTMYIVVALIGVLKIYKRVSALTIWKILFVAEAIILTIGTTHFDFQILYLRIDRIILLALLFFTGIVMYKEAKRIELSYKMGWISLISFIGLSILFPKIMPLLAAIFLAYALFALGRSSRMNWVSRVGDLSYGIYIYSFPVQQIIYALTQTHDVLKMFVASYVVSIILAFISWHFIESKALKLKSKINTKRYPVDQADNAW